MQNEILMEENKFLRSIQFPKDEPSDSSPCEQKYASILTDMESLLKSQNEELKKLIQERETIYRSYIRCASLVDKQSSVIESMKEAFNDFMISISTNNVSDSVKDLLSKYGISVPEISFHEPPRVSAVDLDLDAKEVFDTLNGLAEPNPSRKVINSAYEIIVQQIKNSKTLVKTVKQEKGAKKDYVSLVKMIEGHLKRFTRTDELDKCRNNIEAWINGNKDIDVKHEIDFALGMQPSGEQKWDESLRMQLDSLKKEIIQMQNQISRENEERIKFIRKNLPSKVPTDSSWRSVASYLLNKH